MLNAKPIHLTFNIKHSTFLVSSVLMTCKYFIPGPTWVRPEILREMTRPMIGHRSAEFKELFQKIVADLKPLFATQQDTFVATCSGTGVMEAALANCVPRCVLATTCGAFSEKWGNIAE